LGDGKERCVMDVPELVMEATRLDTAKAAGDYGSYIMCGVKLAEEVGVLLKCLSAMHRVGVQKPVYVWSYFDSELSDLTCQVDILCRRRGGTFEDFLVKGRERFEERLELKEKW